MLNFHHYTEAVVGDSQAFVLSVVGLDDHVFHSAVGERPFRGISQSGALFLAVALHVEEDRDDESHVNDSQLRLYYIFCLFVSTHVHNKLVLLFLEPFTYFFQPSLEPLEEALWLWLEDNVASHLFNFERILEEQHHCHANSVIKLGFCAVVEGDYLVNLFNDNIVLHVNEQAAYLRYEF